MAITYQGTMVSDCSIRIYQSVHVHKLDIQSLTFVNSMAIHILRRLLASKYVL